MSIGGRRIAILFLGVAGLCLAQEASQYAGTWLLKSNGQTIFKLTLAVQEGGITGSLTEPSQLTFDQDGDVTKLGSDHVNLPIEKAAWKGGQLELRIDGDRYTLTLEDHDRAMLEIEGVRPLRLERAADGTQVVLATRLAEPDYPPAIRALRDHLRSMVAQDQEARLSLNQAGMETADAENRREVLRIFDRYGWVTNSLAGKDAAHNFWLLIQHQTPVIQQRLLPALEKAAKDGNASMSDYAYLYDRVQMGLDKPQHWGTQAKCEKGRPMLYAVDDLAGLDARRKQLFMPPIGEYLQTDYMVKFCAQQGK